MRSFFQTFYGKLSAIFLILLLLMAVIQIFITIEASSSFYSQTDQALNQNLAKDIAAEFAPAVNDGLDMPAIEHMMHYMMVMNPKIEIYLLDDKGKILAFFAEPQKKVKAEYVTLEPVKHFINGSEEIPILGDDPRHPGRRKVFSAAPIQIAGEPGYLYVIIESEQFDTAASGFRAAFMTSTVIRGLVITLVFTGIIGLILFALLTRRLRRMSEAVKKFEQGKFDQRISDQKKDEIGQLAMTFNGMADTIVANMEELKKTDRLRRELIANVAHDLRSPLASIKGYLETIQIKDKQLTPQDREKYIAIILGVTNMLEGLVEQLFELSKLDARQTQAHLEPFSITDLVQDVVMKFKPWAEKSHVELQAVLPEQLPQVYADIGLIERALSNLIENALRYTPENGNVKIEIDKSEQTVKVVVADTGSGIQEEELPLIFDRFYRVEKSRARATGGAGLGLAIAKKIIDLHQSSIAVESKVNVGTTFSFNLKAWQSA
jgi:signal transduction histidine kinase